MTEFNTAAAIGDDGTLLAHGYRLDQYEIESVLAVGDFRITYYAWDHRDDRNVVIHEYYPRSLCVRGEDKIGVTSQTKERFTDFEFGLSEFLLEARLVSQIRSPYLPNVIEYREANGTGYLVSEYNDGRTMAEWLKKDTRPFPEKQLGEILNSSLQGLRELHARNLLHTNVCPTTLFIRYHGHPILLGQGLARYRLAQYTKTYTISLSPGYTPLEQYSLDGNIGPWSDLYALGASLYECIAGIRPIDASTRHTSLIKGEQDPLTPAVEIAHGSYSSLLLSNIDWMLKLYLEDRPDSADLMLGVVSFQKQTKHNKRAAISPAPTNTDAADDQPDNDQSSPLASAAASGNPSTETVQPENMHTATADSGRKFYLGLGLLLLAFIGVTAYQIYEHEIRPRATGVETQSLENPISPESVTPPTVQTSDETKATAGTGAENRMISRESDEQRREFYESVYQENEVERRVQEELEALKLVEQAKTQREEVDRILEIDLLLKKAVEAIENENLLNPEGESAFDYFSSILAIDPTNESAMTGLNEIADSFFNQAIAAIDRGDPDSAGKNLKKLIKVRPDDPRLDGFLQQITDLKAKIKLDKVKLELEEKARVEQAEIERLAQEKLEKEKLELQRIEQEKLELLRIEQEKLEQQRIRQQQQNTQESQDDSTRAAQTSNTRETGTEQVLANVQTPVNENQSQSAASVNTESESTPASEPQPAPRQSAPAINRAKLVKDYQRYDRGEFSSDLFESLYDAANANDGRAQYIIAEMYAAGRGTDKNFAESTYWLKKSLDFVNKNAQLRQAWAEKAMGVIYEKGWYVDSNPERAVRWYRSSADKDYPPAQYRLGLAYAKGLGVQKDTEQASFWFKKALSNGNQEAGRALSKLPVPN